VGLVAVAHGDGQIRVGVVRADPVIETRPGDWNPTRRGEGIYALEIGRHGICGSVRVVMAGIKGLFP
jgi:hypothetical protein